MITITERAVLKLKEIAESEEIGHTSVRVQVLGGHCAGFQHDINFDNIIRDTDEVINIDDVQLLIDQLSFQYLENMQIDWAGNDISGGFSITSPDIKGHCGCGKSVKY